jgi:parallel beta-helix repeat protein
MTGNKAIVDDAGATNVTIKGFTITGPGGGPGDSIRYGVRVDHGGSANIIHNHITHIEDTPFSGTQNGVAIQVGRQAEGTTGSAFIADNTIDNYQKGGIVVSNTGSSAVIDDNSVQGAGPTAVIAQNGIQISDGASGKITDNDVSGNVYTPQTVAGTGILLLNAGAVTVSGNRVSHNDYGIFAGFVTGVVIVHNHVSASTFDGILLDAVTHGRIDHNVTDHNGSGQPGQGGILLFNSTNNVVDHNVSNHNNGDGIVVDSTSSNNTLSHNHMTGNTLFDAEDDSTGTGTGGTANTWTDNECNTDNRGGALCTSKHDGHGDQDDHGDHDDGDESGDHKH